MKYTVNFSCGHTETVALFGKVSERENKISYYETKGVCSACCRAERAARIADENAEAARIAETLVLPELTGSVKQVAWATTIRVQAHEEFINSIKPELREEAEIFFYKFSEKHSEASWWITDRATYGILTDLKPLFKKQIKEDKEKETNIKKKEFVCKVNQYQNIDMASLSGHKKKSTARCKEHERQMREVLAEFIYGETLVLTEEIKNHLKKLGWEEEHFRSQFDDEEDLECYIYRNDNYDFVILFDIKI